MTTPEVRLREAIEAGNGTLIAVLRGLTESVNALLKAITENPHLVGAAPGPRRRRDTATPAVQAVIVPFTLDEVAVMSRPQLYGAARALNLRAILAPAGVDYRRESTAWLRQAVSSVMDGKPPPQSVALNNRGGDGEYGLLPTVVRKGDAGESSKGSKGSKGSKKIAGKASSETIATYEGLPPGLKRALDSAVVKGTTIRRRERVALISRGLLTASGQISEAVRLLVQEHDAASLG